MDYLFYFLLLPYATNKPAAAPIPTPGTQPVATTPPVNQAPEIPACMSDIIYKRYKNDFNLDDADVLERVTINFFLFKIVVTLFFL